MAKLVSALRRRLFMPPERRPLAYSPVLSISAGVGLLLLVTVPGWHRERELATTYVQQTCSVVDRRVVNNGDTYRPELLLEYSYGGSRHRVWSTRPDRLQTSDRGDAQAAIEPYRPPTERPCWVDPREPERAYVLRGSASVPWIFYAFALGLLAFGGRALYWNRRLRGLSPEAIASLRETERRATSESLDSHPTVPAPEHRTGAELAYRLPAVHELGGLSLPLGLFLSAFTALFVFLSGAVAWGASSGISKLIGGLFFLATGALTIASLVQVIRRALLVFGVPPTTVELSRSPIVAGEPFRVLVNQRGSMFFNSLRVTLVCEEKVVYYEGTDLRTETRTVYEAALFAEELVRVRRGKPLSLRCEHRLPRGAMHSFEANHNSVRWALRCRGDMLNFPDFDREVRLVVLPAAPRRGDPYREAEA